MIDNQDLIIGNKPYITLPLNNIINSFKTNTRCNMGVPNHNNGTKLNRLALCNHLYANLIQKESTLEQLMLIYRQEYKRDCIIDFFNHFSESKDKYGTIYYAEPNQVNYNKILQSYKCPYVFHLQPRTGYVVLLDNLLKGNFVYISHFSIHDEIRLTYYVKDYVFEREEANKSCHSKTDELKILRWLHNQKIIDATLCMLCDDEQPTLDCRGMKPSQTIIDLLCEEFGHIDIEES